MGRYYDGDISGKFNFGVQSSDAFSRFGNEPSEVSTIEYYYCKEDIEGVSKELDEIEKNLDKKYKDFRTKYLNKEDSEEIVNDWNNLTENILHGPVTKILEVPMQTKSDLADYYIGTQLERKLLLGGECTITCEL